MNTAVYRRNIAPDAGNSPRSQFIHHIVPKLSPNTGHKYFHSSPISIHFLVIVLILAGNDGLPPILVQIGENELMLSDAMRLATHLADNRVRVNLEVWPAMFHAWHFYATMLPEGQQAMESSVRFIETGLADANR